LAAYWHSRRSDHAHFFIFSAYYASLFKEAFLAEIKTSQSSVDRRRNKKNVLARCKNILLMAASLSLTKPHLQRLSGLPLLVLVISGVRRVDLQSSRLGVRYRFIRLVVVPKTDAKPHLFIAPSQELCAVSSFKA
jgi:hypothetical protein